jgi:hypothetical protein
MPFSTNNIQPDFQTPLSYLYVGPTAVNTGFTPIVPVVGSANPADDTITYFVSETGNDANDGLTIGTAFRWPRRAINAVRKGFPDHIAIPYGSTFISSQDPNSTDGDGLNIFGKSSLERAVMYGFGVDATLDRPVLDGYGLFANDGISNANYQGLKFYEGTKDPSNVNFTINFEMQDEIIEGETVWVDVVDINDDVQHVTYTFLNGDTGADAADALSTLMNAILGVTTVREVFGANEGFTVKRQDPGAYYPIIKAASGEDGISGDYYVKIGVHGAAIGLNEIADNCLFEDCVFKHLEISASGNNNKNNMVVSRCVLDENWNMMSDSYRGGDSRSANVFTKFFRGTLYQECVIDQGGFHHEYPRACGNDRSHTTYLQYNSDPALDNAQYSDNTFESCFVSRSADVGLLMRPGGSAMNNLISRCPVGINMGNLGNSSFLAEGCRTYVQGNCILELHTGYFGVYDVDRNPGSRPTQSRRGVSILNSFEADVIVTGNIVAGVASSDLDFWPAVFGRSLVAPTSYVYEYNGFGTTPEIPYIRTEYPAFGWGVNENNIAYHVDNTTQGDENSYGDPTRTAGRFYREQVFDTGLFTQLQNDGYTNLTSLDDSDDFINCVDLFKSRLPGQWSNQFDVAAMLNWIRAGFE